MIQECYDLAAKNGWHEEPRPIYHSLMLVADEAMEAMKAEASGLPLDFKLKGNFDLHEYKAKGKETVVTELADVVIRCFDLAADYELDLTKAIIFKLIYNQTRGYRHGGKVL